MSMHRSALATLSQALYNFLKTEGLDADRLFQSADMDPAKLFEADARFPIHNVNRIWRIAATVTGRPTITYDVMPFFEPTMFHAMGHAWLVSRNVLEALERFVRYHRMLSTNVEINLEKSATICKLSGRLIGRLCSRPRGAIS